MTCFTLSIASEIVMFVMTVLGDPGDSRDYPLLRSLPLCNQRVCLVEHGSVQPNGVPMLEGTLWDMMMHVSPLLVHMLLMRFVE